MQIYPLIDFCYNLCRSLSIYNSVKNTYGTFVTTMTVKRIRKQEFCERVYSQFITMATDVKKKKAWHGFYTNILPIVLYPVSFFMILCLL